LPAVIKAAVLKKGRKLDSVSSLFYRDAVSRPGSCFLLQSLELFV
jgi:hypothetical protein